MKSIRTIIQCLLLVYFFSGSIHAQMCGGSVTLTTQAQVNMFSCSSLGGDLIIDDGGTGSITNLTPIFINGISNGDVAGSVIVRNCPQLKSLDGLHGITKTGGSFIVTNCPLMQSTGPALFTLFSVAGDLRFVDLPLLEDVGALDNLTNVDGNIIINSVGGTGNFKGLDNITSGKYVEIKLNTFSNLVGLNGMQQCNYLNIVENHNLVSMNAFVNLQNIVVGNGIDGWFQLANNNNIATLPSFPDLVYADKISIVNNPKLATCCSALPILTAPPSFAQVSNNASGCNSVGQVNASPTLSNCPSNQTINTTNNLCTGTVMIADPNAADNCGYDTYEYEVMPFGGSPFGGPASNGFLDTYTFPPGVSTIQWTVTDESNNVASCSISVTVVDDQFPVFSTELPSNLTIATASNSCTATHTLTFPTGSDNCGITSTELAVFVDGVPGNVFFNGSAVQGQSYSIPLDIGTYNVEAKIKDATGKIDRSTTILTVEDGTNPVISNVPADVTINCDDAFPQTPNAIATDNCDPNPGLTATSSVSTGDCTLGGVAEIQSFTWTATDASGNVSTKDWKVTVLSDFSFDLGPPVNLCGASSYNINPGNIGQSYLWSTGATSPILPVTQSGTYSLTVFSNNGCCYTDEVTVTFGSQPDANATGATLSCSSASVQISGSSTTSGVSYSWTGPGGFTSNMQNPMVSAVGQYTLTVTSSPGCSSTANATVTADTDVPDANATGGFLSCAVSSIQINSSSSTAGVSYTWSGPAGFSSNMQNPTVTAAGLYTVTVLSANGCDATATAVVTNDNTPPSISLSADDLNCANATTIISVSSNSDISSYNWAGPSGFTSSDAAPSVMEGGMYSATITGENGCTNTASITIGSDTEIPDITASGGILNCEANSTQIFSNSSVVGALYQWTGPNDFTSTEKDPIVTQPGIYIILVTAPNGCSISTSAEVEADGDLPSISATGGEINCLIESVLIQGSTTSTGSTTMWSGPNGFTSTENDVEVTQGGTYKYTVIAASGCEAFKEVEVIINTQDPDITLFQGDLNCELGVRTFVLNTDAVDGTFAWSGPNGFTSDVQSPEYSLAGTYSVTITGTNGCQTEGEVTVANDVSYTQHIVVDGNDATIEITGGTPPFIISWDNGNSGEMASNLSDGSHTVSVIDGLGCENIFNFNIGTSSTDDFIGNDKVKISPNPTQDLLRIDWQALEIGIKNIRVVDLQGRLLMSKGATLFSALKETTIDVSDLNEGVYFIQIYTEDKSVTKKFIKI